MLSKFPRPVLAARGHRNVRATGVLAGERPLGFAVSNEVKAREPVLPVDYLFAPHFQFRISGRSSPFLSMYCLCSISLSLNCCFSIGHDFLRFLPAAGENFTLN